MRCPHCDSRDIIKAGRQLRLGKSWEKPQRVQRWRCKKCGKFTVYPTDGRCRPRG